jgi:hypothetical protein
VAKIITKNGVISSSAGVEFQTGASASLYVSSSGVGIGTTSPSSSLDIADGYVLIPELADAPATPPAAKGALYASGSDSHIYWKSDAGQVFDLTQTGTGSSSDELAKVSANDTTAGYLNGKLVAGTNITFNERNNGGNETLEISASIGGRTDSGTSATDPGGAVEGDKYYNTDLEMEMRYDGLRSKWLSVETSNIAFGKSGNGAAGAYFDGPDGIAFSSTEGFATLHSGTVVAIGYTRTDNDAAVFQVTADGNEIAFISSSAVLGVDTTLNGDFSPNQVLGVLNKSGGNTVSNIIGWVKVKWRI